MNERGVASLGKTFDGDECMDKAALNMGNLAKDSHPFPKVLFVFFRDGIGTLLGLDFAKVANFVCTRNYQIYLRPLLG